MVAFRLIFVAESGLQLEDEGKCLCRIIGGNG